MEGEDRREEKWNRESGIIQMAKSGLGRAVISGVFPGVWGLE